MKTFELVTMESYKLPLTKREVKKGVPFTCGEREATLIGGYGHFIEVEVKDNQLDEFGGLFAQAPETQRSIPKDWTNKTILFMCYGGIGDCLIASSVCNRLKTKQCHVTFAVGENALEFCKYLDAPDDVVKITSTNSSSYKLNFDVIVDSTGYALSGPRTIVDKDFYTACFDKIGFYEEPILPQFVLPRQTDAVKSKLRQARVHMQDVVCVHTEPTAMHRKWPHSNWAETFKIMVTAGKRIMLLGKPMSAFDDIEGVVNCTDLSVVEQLQICNASRHFVGIDSCWAHIAGLMNKEGMVIFSPSVPENLIARYGRLYAIQPYGQVCKHRNFHSQVQDDQICECIKDLSPSALIDSMSANLFPVMKNLAFKRNLRSLELPEDKLSRNQRLTFVFPHIMLGGGETASLELCRGLKEYFDFNVVALKGWEPENNILEDLKEFNTEVVENSSGIAKHIKDSDIVLWYGMNDVMVDALRNLQERPVSIRVVHTHFKQEAEDFTESYSGYIDATVCVSPIKAKEMNCHHIPNAINLKALEGYQKVENDIPTVGFIGRLDQNKNIKWLIENIGATGHRLIIQGLDEVYTVKELKERCRQLGIADKVEFINGPVIDFYNKIDVLCLPSKLEALPMVILEAGYLGIPSIRTDVGGIKALLGDHLICSLDIENGIPSFVDFKQALIDYRKINTRQLKETIARTCVRSVVAEKFKKLIRKVWGESLPDTLQHGAKEFARYEGIGDVLMATSVVRRYAEILPNAFINFYTSKKCANTVTEMLSDLHNVTIVHSSTYKKEIGYNNSWAKEIHALKGMGGKAADMMFPTKKFKAKGNRKKARIGILPYMNKGAKKKLKEWPETRWKALISELRKEGYSVYQLGHTSDTMLGRLKDGRADDLSGLIENFADMDYVIGIEGLAVHIGKAIGKPILVIQGNASRPWHTSYDLHDHVMSNTDCFCFGSIAKELEKTCNIECMYSIMTKRVLKEFRKHVYRVDKGVHNG